MAAQVTIRVTGATPLAKAQPYTETPTALRKQASALHEACFFEPALWMLRSLQPGAGAGAGASAGAGVGVGAGNRHDGGGFLRPVDRTWGHGRAIT